MRDHDANNPHDPKKTLSEISHLFLSSIRERQTDGAAKPRRTPPAGPKPPGAKPRAEASVDLTPEEFANVYGGGAAGAVSSDVAQSHQKAAETAPSRKGPPALCAVIASHLNGRQF